MKRFYLPGSLNFEDTLCDSCVAKKGGCANILADYPTGERVQTSAVRSWIKCHECGLPSEKEEGATSRHCPPNGTTGCSLREESPCWKRGADQLPIPIKEKNEELDIVVGETTRREYHPYFHPRGVFLCGITSAKEVNEELIRKAAKAFGIEVTIGKEEMNSSILFFQEDMDGERIHPFPCLEFSNGGKFEGKEGIISPTFYFVETK
jgi:hypothetical protein